MTKVTMSVDVVKLDYHPICMACRKRFYCILINKEDKCKGLDYMGDKSNIRGIERTTIDKAPGEIYIHFDYAHNGKIYFTTGIAIACFNGNNLKKHNLDPNILYKQEHVRIHKSYSGFPRKA
jgi:hypothetical protein